LASYVRTARYPRPYIARSSGLRAAIYPPTRETAMTWALVQRIHGCKYPKDEPFSTSKPYSVGCIEIPFLESRNRVIGGGTTLEIYVRFKPGYKPVGM
jgi:hypothetical protein